MRFQHPVNGYVEHCSVPFLWALIFGPLYFVLKGIWRHVVLYFTVNFVLISFSWAFALGVGAATEGAVTTFSDMDGRSWHAPIALIVIIAALILPFLFYPFIASGIVRRHFLRQGWHEVDKDHERIYEPWVE